MTKPTSGQFGYAFDTKILPLDNKLGYALLREDRRAWHRIVAVLYDRHRTRFATL